MGRTAKPESGASGRSRGHRTTAASDTRRKGRLRVEALEAIRAMIVSGELRPGERLREVALTAALGMSRTPIREAFRTLAAEGLVNLLPNRSVVVTAPNESEAADVFAVLDTLERLACRFACRRFTATQVAMLRTLHARSRRHFERGDCARYLEASRTMRARMVRGAGNQSLVLAWQLLLPHAERARRNNPLVPPYWEAAFQADCGIVAAIAARDERLLDSCPEPGIGEAPDRGARNRIPVYAEA